MSSTVPSSSASRTPIGIATSTSFVAMTTPFVQPPSCTDIWTITTITTSQNFYPELVTYSFTVRVSDISDPRFATCQPPGWASAQPPSRFTFSPAVCPSGWTAYNVDTVMVTATASKPASAFNGTSVATPSSGQTSAYCCSSGFALVFGGFGVPSIAGVATAACWRQDGAASRTISAQGASNSRVITVPLSYVQVHNAWEIRWAASDIPTLSPTPPDLSKCPRYFTWVPGETPVCLINNSSSDGLRGWETLMFLAIGLPLIFLALFAVCCTFLVRYRAKDRRKRKAFEKELAERHARELQERQAAAESAEANATATEGHTEGKVAS